MNAPLTKFTNDPATRKGYTPPRVLRHPVTPTSNNVLSLQRKSSCACGGGCPACQAKSSGLKVSQPNEPAEIEADRIADKVMRMPENQTPPVKNYQSPSAGIHRKCRQCEEANPIQRKAENSTNTHNDSKISSQLANVFGSGGQALDNQTRAFFEPRFGHDFSGVRIHTGTSAENSSAAIDAKAYTLGSDIVFAKSEYRPATDGGKRLLAHELAHVVQQGTGQVQRLQRTPANKVSCANRTPLVIPGTGVSIADPVGVITAAEDRANQMFDDVISELDFTRQQILGGAPVAWPTISDAIAEGLVLMGLDLDDPAVWTAPNGTGLRSVPLLLRRLRLIRGTIGAGSFFFFCLGTGMTRLGGCGPQAGAADICAGAEAATCAGEFFTAFCPDFWTQSAEMQAATLVHETSHNFATFIGHTGRFTNAECFARLIQVFAGVPVAEQRTDLCPDP